MPGPRVFRARLLLVSREDFGRLRVAKLGASSVRYEIGLFAQDAPLTAAKGHFVHVYVDRMTRRPVSISPALRAVLESLK